MYYLQPQFPPPCGPFCPGCQLCCDVIFCDNISTADKNIFNDSSTKSLIEVLENVKRRTEFLQRKLFSFEKNSIGTQVEKLSGLPTILESSNIDLETTTSMDSGNVTVQNEQMCNLLYDKSISPEGSKNVPNDPKEMMSLYLTMMKEIREVREKMQNPPKRVCRSCHSGRLDSQKNFKSLMNENDQQNLTSTTNCPTCKRILSCHQNPQFSPSRGMSCYLKNRRNFYHPSVNDPRAYPHRRDPRPEEIQNTWCCWPFF